MNYRRHLSILRPEIIGFTWVSHHQFAIHISSYTWYLPSTSVKCFSGAYFSTSLKAGFPISSLTHSTGSRLQSSSCSGAISSCIVEMVPRRCHDVARLPGSLCRKFINFLQEASISSIHSLRPVLRLMD